MAVNYGSKRIVVGAHYGLRDWLSQRITGALMAIFTLIVLGQLLLTSGQVHHCGIQLGQTQLAQWQADIAHMPQDIALEVDLTAVAVVLLGRIANLGIHVGDERLQPAQPEAGVEHCLAQHFLLGQAPRLG